MASPVKSDFPKFVDGDVLVIISTTQYYKLHSQVLQTHSRVFADQFTANPGPRLNAQARRENAAAYRFELAKPTEDSAGQFLRIVRYHLVPHRGVTSADNLATQEVKENGRSPGTNVALLPDFENGRPENIINQAWDWLFGIFYNREPHFDDTNLATILACVMGLIEVAESIGSIDHIRDTVDLALMRQDNVLWSSIMGNPGVWVGLGRRVRSPAIYREAAVHLIGQWGTLSDEEKQTIDEDVRNILQRKADELALAKEAIEMRIIGHYPQFMTRIAGEKPGRPSYGHDIYMWQCVAFFRHWFAQNISDDRTRRAPDGGLAFYKALHDGGDAYLTHEDFENFHRFFPMSIKACNVLEANMSVLKADIKQFVEALMAEHTHLKRAEHNITWLTCAKIEKEDLPWANEAKGSRAEEGLKELYQTLDGEQAAMEREETPPRPAKRARLFVEDDDDEDDDEGLFVPEGDLDAMDEDIE